MKPELRENDSSEQINHSLEPQHKIYYQCKTPSNEICLRDFSKQDTKDNSNQVVKKVFTNARMPTYRDNASPKRGRINVFSGGYIKGTNAILSQL